MCARVPKAMAQLAPKIEQLSHSIGTAPIPGTRLQSPTLIITRGGIYRVYNDQWRLRLAFKQNVQQSFHECRSRQTVLERRRHCRINRHLVSKLIPYLVQDRGVYLRKRAFNENPGKEEFRLRNLQTVVFFSKYREGVYDCRLSSTCLALAITPERCDS